MTRTLEVGRPGLVDYGDALAWQESLRDRVLAGGPDVLLLLEHPPVYTLGRAADAAFLGTAPDGGIPVVRTTRGGQVTYHGPGQLVGYPLLDLRRHRADVRWYVTALEEVLIRALDHFGVTASRRRGAPGVWVGARKIGSVGIAIRHWCTWHGFALNVDGDMTPFRAIVPCGLTGVEMTSLDREGASARMDAVVDVVLACFVAVFGHVATGPLSAGGAPPAAEERA
jgi:lipoyl(octanoyl) transferase